MRGLVIKSVPGIRPVGTYHILLKRLVLFFMLLDLLWRGLTHLLPHQLLQNEVIQAHHNITYHLFVLMGLQKAVVGSQPGSIVFEVLLFLSGILAFYRPQNKWFTPVFVGLFFIYGVIIRVNTTPPVHYLPAMIMLSFVLLLKNRNNFEIAWEAMRYYACLLYASAFMWKAVNGILFQEGAGVFIAKGNLNTYLLLNPDTTYAKVLYFFLAHPALLNAGTYFVYLLECFFIVGFFTKKFDYLLLVSLMFIHFSLFIFVDTLFIESYILVLLFLPVACIAKVQDKLSALYPFRKSVHTIS